MKNSKVGVVVALLIKWSGIAVTDGRNKVGGTVLSKSRAGATARNKVTPINRQTSYQQTIRALFSSFSSQFRTLGEDLINAWNAFASANISLRNIFGDVYTLTGNTAFIRLNMNLNTAGSAPITSPPSIEDVAGIISSFNPEGDVSDSELFPVCSFIGGSGNVVPAGNTLVVYATPILSDGKTFVKSQYRIIATLGAAADTSTSNIWNAYSDRFGDPTEGANIRMSVQLINSTSGFTSVPFNERARIVA